MSEYKGIKGFQVQTRTTDPTPYAQALADNPYGGAWASGGTRNETRGALGGSIMGTQTANVAAGGNLSGSVSANAETYDGTSWTEGNNLNQARRSLMAAGLEPAGRVFGGDTSVNSTGFVATNESYNGTSFTEESDLNTGAGAGTGIGLTTAALAVGGSTGPGAPNYSNKVENWDGSSWTEVSEINTTRIRGGGAGVTTAALFSGGQAAPGASNSVESWNGSSWTETTEINTARGYIGSAGSSYTAALIYGGSPSRAITESWDGSSWTEVADLATGQSDNFGIVNGTNLLALSSGGETSPNAVTEEWSFSGLPPSTPAADYADAIVGDFYYNSTTGQFKTVNDGGAPIGTWASGGTMNQSKSSQANIGSSTANNTVGGQTPSPAYLTNNEQYDGTSWTEVNDLSTGRQVGSGIGTSTAGLIAGGRAAPNSTAVVESWDGTNFTEVGDLNQARGYARGAGTQTAAINVGGYLTTPAVRYSLVEEWNGSAWTEIADLNAPRSSGGIAQASPYTSTIVFGGDTGPGPSTTSSIATAETWNGSSWTEVADLNSGRRALGGAGDSISSALAFGGSSVNTEFWNGSSWTEVNNLSDARSWGGNSGSTLDALVCGDEPFSGATEEWNADDFQIKTVTTS